jgi:thiamine-phosphate pyrophosphorylase
MLCLVTDRRRLLPGASFDAAGRRLVSQAQWAAAAGVDLIQIREPDLEAALLAHLVDDVLQVCRGSRTRVVVNDRADVALACGADGVHLRHDSIAAAPLRRIAPPGFLIGRSVHDPAEAATAGPVDYLIAGAVFATSSKPAGHPAIGLDGLAKIVRAAGVPVLAIGGLRADDLDRIVATGAVGIAGIGLFISRFDSRQAPS